MQDYIDRKIDINGKIDKITVKQFDNDSRYLHVVISDADAPDDTKFNLTNCTAALYIQPAGDESGENVAFVAGEVADAEEGIVTFLLPGSVTQAVGDYECEIWMYEGSSSNRPIISGQPFTMTVEKSIRNTSAIMASSQYSALDAWGSEVAALRSEVRSLSALADAGEIPAGTVESEVLGIRIGWDGYEYDSAGDAVQNQIKELHNSLDEKFTVGRNVFNPDAVTEYRYINDSTGEILINTHDTFISDRIPTNGKAKAIFSYVRSDGMQVLQTFKVYQYKANGDFISLTEASVVTLDGQCSYIRFYASSNFTDVRARIMVELADSGVSTFSVFEKYQQRLAPAVSIWKSAASVMSKLILPNRPFTVKLIGDSITQGVGSSDYDASGDVIISDNPTAWSRNVGAKAWAAMFEARVANDYISVINNGVRGCSTHQILYYWNQLIDGTEDIVICMLGTNNRTTADNSTFSYTKQSFYDELQKIKNTLEANGSEVVFMSAPPASVSNESQSGIHFHMNDVDDVISKFAADNNREYISLYKKTLDYMKKTGATLDDLLDDGLHPNDRLHKLMYGWIVEGIGLNREHNPVIDSFMITTNEISEVLTG